MGENQSQGQHVQVEPLPDPQERAGEEPPATQPPPLPPGDQLPDMEELHNTLVPTLKWCPKAARGEFARELASLWYRLSENPREVRLWCLETMFSRAILPAGRGPRVGDAYSQARLVRERLRRWRQGEYRQLWEEAKDLTKEQRRPRGRQGRARQQEEEGAQQKRNAERATTLAQDGQFTRALQALTSSGMAPDTRATREAMKAKHPEPTSAPPPAPTTLEARGG